MRASGRRCDCQGMAQAITDLFLALGMLIVVACALANPDLVGYVTGRSQRARPKRAAPRPVTHLPQRDHRPGEAPCQDERHAA